MPSVKDTKRKEKWLSKGPGVSGLFSDPQAALVMGPGSGVSKNPKHGRSWCPPRGVSPLTESATLSCMSSGLSFRTERNFMLGRRPLPAEPGLAVVLKETQNKWGSPCGVDCGRAEP